MSIIRDVLQGVATLIGDYGVAKYAPTGTYGPSDTAVFFKIMPANPDRVVVLNAWTMSTDPRNPEGVINLQVACRGVAGDRNDVDDLADTVQALLDCAAGQQLGSVMASQILFRSSVPMGEDESNREERADHYLINVDTDPTVNRPG
jgi:hypothetical protein